MHSCLTRTPSRLSRLAVQGFRKMFGIKGEQEQK
jgi:hypothetical protein